MAKLKDYEITIYHRYFEYHIASYVISATSIKNAKDFALELLAEEKPKEANQPRRALAVYCERVSQ